jgi:NAD(P)-dependent dehydrogenase (short-subunit alcohol dehydrogenase family)
LKDKIGKVRIAAMSASSQRAIVTGAASGIGRATARRLATEGIDVLAVDVAAGGLGELANEGIGTKVVDISDPAAQKRLAEDAAGADFLVNAAGIIRVKPILEVSREDWRAVMTVNAESVFFLCQAVGPSLRPGGAIVNVASSSAKLATTVEVAPYAASKSAVTSITRSFAYAFAEIPIRVNAILPGLVDTPMQDVVVAGVAAARGIDRATLELSRTGAVPLGRAATAEDCAGVIWFLLSEAAAYMTGQSVNLTGGLVTW